MAFKVPRRYGLVLKILILLVVIVTLLSWLIFAFSVTSMSDFRFGTASKKPFKVSTRSKKIKKFCSTSGQHMPRGNTSVMPGWDYMRFKRPTFLQNFKNPCFYSNTTGAVQFTADGKKPMRNHSIHCVPYFFIAGFPKAGSTDLWFRFQNHPDIVSRHVKEPMFFNIGKYNFSNFGEAATSYVYFFDKSAAVLEKLTSPAMCQGVFPYHHAITGEASVDTASDGGNRWQQLSRNSGCREPVVTNADYVYHINPNIKIIFLVRNPVDRLYSDYIYEARYLRYRKSRTDFHANVVKTIQNHTDCQQYFSVRTCAYNSSIEDFKVRLRLGMYNIFIQDWLDVFPPENVIVVKAEDTWKDKTQIYNKIFKFLDIRPFTYQESVNVFYSGPVNKRTLKEKRIGEMLPETRRLLQKFYRPYNTKLYAMFPYIDYNAET